MVFENSLAFALKLDREDPLKAFADRFIIPERGGQKQVYFLGNSLGLQPRNTGQCIEEVLNQWARYGVEGFFEGEQPWLRYHDRLLGPLSKLVGALPHEISVMNQLTVNLHLMLVSFYQPSGSKNKILCEAKAFPSDQYMLETHVRKLGFDPNEVIVEVGPRPGEYIIREEDIIQKIQAYKNELALVFWGGLNYYSGQVFDMKLIAREAARHGIKVGFDLAHAVGNIPLALHEWGVDFAAWCSYKYLNSGPGAVGAVYIHEKYHHDNSIHRFAGWWGYDKATRFNMEKGFKPIPTAEGWQLSTPSILLYATHWAALQIFDEAGMERLHEKRQLLSNFFLFLLRQLNPLMGTNGMKCITPEQPRQRGCQFSLLIPGKGKEIFEQLSQKGFMLDWREPDVIRLAPVPLYNTFEEVWRFADTLQQLISS